MRHALTLLKPAIRYLLIILKSIYAVAASAAAVIASFKVYEAYLKIKVLDFEYNILYSVLFLSASAYLILYTFFVASMIRNHYKKAKPATGVV